jgi:hypothetical protein
MMASGARPDVPPWFTITFLVVWAGFLLSIVLHQVWRAIARSELASLGVDVPSWSSRELFQTVRLVRDNRHRLPGAASLYWSGVVLASAVIAWAIAIVGLFVLPYLLPRGVG